MMYSRVARTKQ